MKPIKTIDIDGILTRETEGHGPEAYANRTPNTYAIETIKQYKDRGYLIKLYTARYPEDEQDTIKWLEKYSVPYDELIMNKPQSDEYIDDRAINYPDREILCLSGGLDSIIAWHYLNKPQAIYSLMSHLYQQKEINCLENLKRLIPQLKIIYYTGSDLHSFEQRENAYIPRRNLHLALDASHFGNKIYIVGIKGDDVPDKNLYAFQVITNTFNFIKKPDEPSMTVTSPFWHLTKSDIIKWFLSTHDHSYALNVLRTSVSCYDQSILSSCGACPSCFRKWIALEANNIDCLDWFQNDILKYNQIPTYIAKIKEGHYDVQRATETKNVLKKYNLW